MESYHSQQPAMEREAEERGISSQRLHDYFEQELAQITRSHRDQTGIWRLARAEQRTWERFFPYDPFPASTQELSQQSMPKSRSMIDSIDMNSDWIHDKYSEDQLPRRGPAQALPSRWSRRTTDSYRPSPRSSNNRRLNSRHHRSTSRKRRSFSKTTSDATRKPSYNAVNPSSLTPSTLISRDDCPENDQAPAYQNFEALMEYKANSQGFRSKFFQYLNNARLGAIENHEHCSRVVRGYISSRQTWTRFWPNERFPGIEPKDGHTDQCIRKSQRTKASAIIPPTPKQPSAMNIQQSAPLYFANHKRKSGGDLRLSKSQDISDFKPQEAQTLASIGHLKTNLPARPVSSISMQGQPLSSLIESAPSSTLLCSLLNAQRLYKNPGTIIMIDNTPMVFPHPGFVMSTYTSLHSESPQNLEQICTGLRCSLFHHKVATGDLLLWAVPNVHGDYGALNGGHMFLEGWIIRSHKFGLISPSSYYREIQGQDILRLTDPMPTAASASRSALTPAPAISSAESMKYNEASSTLALVTSVPSSSQALVLAIDHWAEYRASFNPSELDVLFTEETAKAEGGLRMVLDQETREVVPLKELLARTSARNSIMQENAEQSAAVAGRKRKIKVEASEDEDDNAVRSAIKRICL